MLNIHVFGRPGSTYMRELRSHMGSALSQSHGAVNYGLQGTEALESYFRRHSRLNNIPVINKYQFGNKLVSAVAANGDGVPTPISALKRDAQVGRGIFTANMRLIAKPFYSLGGRNIYRIDNTPTGISEVNGETHYIQEEITNRRYELRCHAFAWKDPATWLFQKRVHPDGDEQLTWNHHTGGTFITIEDPSEPLFERVRESCKILLRTFRYGFAAFDFIIKNPGERGMPLKHYFIEANLAPGFTMDRTRDYYLNVFNDLKLLDIDDFESVSDGIILSEGPEEQTQQDDTPETSFEFNLEPDFSDQPEEINTTAEVETVRFNHHPNINDFPQMRPRPSIAPPAPVLLSSPEMYNFIVGNNLADLYYAETCVSCTNAMFVITSNPEGIIKSCPRCGGIINER